MTKRVICGAVLALVTVSPAAASDAENAVLARVRLTTEPSHTRGCTRLGSVSDDNIKDLRRKVVRLGGDTALLAFGREELAMVYAQVFRCPPPAPPAPPSAKPAPPPPPPPAGTPPPPAGTPPPGPPPPPPPPTPPPTR
jgi:hypothetical protein